LELMGYDQVLPIYPTAVGTLTASVYMAVPCLSVYSREAIPLPNDRLPGTAGPRVGPNYPFSGAPLNGRESQL
jgi:hypothetical protein